jgi:hypothetical protein
MISRLLDDRVPRDALLRSLRAERGRYIETLLPSARSSAPGAAALVTALSQEGQWTEPLPLPMPSSGAAAAILSRPVDLARAQEMLERLNHGISSLSTAPDLPEFVLEFPADELSGIRGIRQGEQQSDSDAARVLTFAIQNLGRGHYGILARRRTAAAALAVALYHAEQGHWPANGLASLVPAYLPAVPRDPLSTCGNPLIFIADSERPRVYSVGDDGIDDGGWPGDPNTSPRREDVRLTDWVIDLLRQPRVMPSPMMWRGNR